METALARSSFIASGCALLDLQHFGGWDLIQHLANIDSPGGIVGSYIIQLTVPYALGSVGAGVLFATIFGISAIYLFNVNPVMTVLNAFSWYREWKVAQRGRTARQGPAAGTARGAAASASSSKIEELEQKGRAGSPSVPGDRSRPPPKFNIRRPDEETKPTSRAEPLVKVPMNPPKPASARTRRPPRRKATRPSSPPSRHRIPITSCPRCNSSAPPPARRATPG